MAVSFDAVSESHTATTGSASEASFSWSHNPVGVPRGIAVLVINSSSGNAANKPTSVTYDGENLTEITAASATDTSGEGGTVTLWFLGSGINTTDPATVVVNRVNNVNDMYAVCVSVSAAGDTEVYEAGIVNISGDSTLGEQSVSDGSPGTNSMRFAGGHCGSGAVPAAGSNSTALASIDYGAKVAAVVRETTAGQGSRSVGFGTITSDDAAITHFAIREASGGSSVTASASHSMVLAYTAAAVRGRVATAALPMVVGYTATGVRGRVASALNAMSLSYAASAVRGRVASAALPMSLSYAASAVRGLVATAQLPMVIAYTATAAGSQVFASATHAMGIAYNAVAVRGRVASAQLPMTVSYAASAFQTYMASAQHALAVAFTATAARGLRAAAALALSLGYTAVGTLDGEQPLQLTPQDEDGLTLVVLPEEDL